MTEVISPSQEGHRPQTPHATSLLKTIRYEDTVDGRPPIPVTTVNQHKAPSSSNSAAQSTEPGSPNQIKESTASHKDRASALGDEVKRDSAIAPPLSTGGRESYAESHLSILAGTSGAKATRGLPSIVVQDGEPLDAPERSRSPFARKWSREKPPKQRIPKSQSPSSVSRMKSFKGIQTDIPDCGLKDLSLEDLASDQIGFSNRGSLLFGGKKMNDVIELQGDGAGEVTLPTQNGAPKQGLVAGRRKPSIQMLQAAMQQGRVLSAEEITFSMKVRSMYEYGDEKAAQWIIPAQYGTSGKDTPESLPREDSSPNAISNDISVGKTRRAEAEQATLQPVAQNVRASYYTKQANELAGGVEDWQDVDGQDVDRYGFINPNLSVSRNSSASHAPSHSIQRVATGLRLVAEQPRKSNKLHRGPSNARSARSVPAKSTSGPGSVRSFQSGHSGKHRASLFRSKDNRIFNEASNMLTPPPGLAGAADSHGPGKGADSVQRREWVRNDKWQKMARPVREQSSSAGGGMLFDFDTSDSKLIERTWKGIPDRWRSAAWHSFLSTSAKRRGPHATDEELVTRFHQYQEVNSAEDVQIDLDVPRTINMHIMFRKRYRGGQRLLFRVLHAISLYFPDTGYVQGMAALAATLLCYYDEERAFVMMVRMWQLRGLEQLFQNGFEGLMTALTDFETHWLGSGDVAQQLEELCITSTAWGTRWYLTLFNMSIPFPAQLRVWDVFMLLGDASPPDNNNAFGGADMDVLHATSAALIDATREILLDSDFENAMKVLTSFIPVKDEDLLMRVARAEWKMRKKRAGGKA